ncbi:MAG: Endonuclease/exonuclease/phosphatase family protein, partial [Myxococcaceae bacterium]|nr:Endonuclease/exonuclease/phosphatase family protein [Myxococcaceae bacterium]
MKPSISKLVAAGALLFAGVASAQIYTVNSQSQTWSPLSGAGVQTVTLQARDSFGSFDPTDEGWFDVPLGFNFPYYGTTYTTVHVDSNGFLMLGTSTACNSPAGFACYSGGGIPSTSRTPHNVIAPWWLDADVGTLPAGSIKYKQSAGQVEIEYDNWACYGGGCGFSFKVTLTASGLFQIHYGAYTGSSFSSATVGWENQGGTAGGNFLGCSATSAGCASSNWPTNTLYTIGQPVQPDVVVASVNISNLTGGGASNISVDIAPTFQNYGQNPTGATPFGWKAYLSTDKFLNAGDILIHTAPATINLTGAGTAGAVAISSGSGTTSTPPPPGQYFVIVEADPAPGVVTEASETNNVGSTANYFVSGLDLVATQVSGPANSGPGNPIVVNAKWFNQGTDPVPAPGTVNFRVLLSLDNMISTTDFPLFSGSKVITGGQTVDDNLSFNVPGNVPGGDFFYILQIDPGSTVAEASETNNFVVSSGKVTMKQADLVNTGTDFLDPITAAPTRIGYFGQDARVSVKIDNVGGANGNNFKVGVVISSDATLSLLSDTIAVEQNVALVAQGTSLSVDIPFTMPLKDRAGVNFPTGNYYVFTILDSTSQVTELNEANNNLVVNGTIQLRAPAPDLTVTRVEAAASGAVGEILPVLRTLKNIGNVASPAVKYRYFASANPIITTDDVPLQIMTGGNGAIEGTTTLAIGAADTQTELVKLPASMPAGTYYLGVIIDTAAAVAEIDEQNNALASSTVQIAASSLRISTQQLPDAVVDRPYSYRLVALGEQGGASTWAVDPSQGTLPAGMTLATDGLLTGTPTSPAVSGFTAVITNNGRDAQAHLVLRVLPTTTQVEITTTSVPAVINTNALKYEFSLGAAGGVKPYEWKIISGALPQNLILTNNGIITGNPKVGLLEGASNVTIEVRDSLGTTAQKSLSMRVIGAGSIIFRNLQLSSGLVGENYFTDIAIQNADNTVISPAQKPLTWTRQGELPDGLVLNPAGDVAVIEGKPLRAGTFTFSLTVEDAKGRNDTAEFMIRISPARFKLASTGLPELIRPGDAISFNITATTQASPKFSLYSGALAPGLTLAADGKVEGTVPMDNSEGTYNFVVEARDDTGATGLGAFTLEVKREIKPRGCNVGGLGSLWMLAALLPVAMRRRFPLALRKGTVAGAIALALAILPAAAVAQTYQLSGPTPITYAPIAGGTPVSTGTPVTIPFPFSFYGQAVSSATMSQYGYLLIAGYAYASTNQGVPHATTGSFYPTSFMAPWWDTLSIPTGSNLRWQVFGATPNRYMVFEWNQISTSSVATKFSFEVILYESTHQIRFVYGSTAPASGSSSVGIQAALGTGLAALSCTAANTGTPGCGTGNYPAGQAIDFFLPPDLTVASVTGDQTGYAGVAYRATALVKNVGGRAANNVTVRFYLSANATYEATDQLIGEANVASIAAGGEALMTANAPIPSASAPGPFFVIARADPDDSIVEQSELNNIGTPTQMSVGVATADLVVSSVTGPTGGTGAPGAAISAIRVIANVGNAAAAAFKYTWFLSDNSVVTISDLKLSPVGSLAGLASGANDTQTEMITLPAALTAGQYWLGLCVNYEQGATPEFGITEITQVNNCATAATPILVSTGQVAVITSTLPPATQYSPYGLRLKAAGGNGTYTWAQTGGSLPPGVSLAATGDLQGTPATAGTFAFDVKVSSGGADATASLTLMISTGTLPLAVVDQDLPAAEFSRSYLADLVAVGGKPPYLWTLKPETRLPVGLALSPDGQIEGRASEGGDILFGVICTDSAGTKASKDLKIKVVNPATLHIATAGLPTGYLKQSYLHVLQAVGGTPGYDWTLVRYQQLAENVTEQDGAPLGNGKDSIPFPATLGLKIEDGGNGSDYLRGTPKQAGLFLLTLKVVDTSPVAAEDYTQLLLRVSYVEGLAITTLA